MKEFLENFLPNEIFKLGYIECNIIYNGDAVIIGLKAKTLKDTQYIVSSLSVLEKVDPNKREQYLRELLSKIKK